MKMMMIGGMRCSMINREMYAKALIFVGLILISAYRAATNFTDENCKPNIFPSFKISSLFAYKLQDLSHNNLSGELPSSIGDLSSLTTLYLQNNQLNGTLDVLQDLPLSDLNVENNLFTGEISDKMLGIPIFASLSTNTLPSLCIRSRAYYSILKLQFWLLKQDYIGYSK